MTNEDHEMREFMQRTVPSPAREITLEQVKAAASREMQRRHNLPRKTWAPLLSAAAVLVLAAVVATVYGFGGRDRQAAGPEASPTISTGSTSGSTAPSIGQTQIESASSSPATVSGCSAAQMTASIGRQGSVASSPFVVVVLRSHGPATCSLSGYPTVQAFAAGRLVRVSIQHGTYEVPDQGPQLVDVDPAGAVSFALGTSTGYSGAPITISRIVIQLPGDIHGSLVLPVPGGLGATSATDGTFPLGITAIAAGTGS